MSFSVNTNNAAAAALQNLSATTMGITTAQNQISTGLKVASAKDNAAVYAIAQNQRATVGALDTVSASLSRGQSVVDLASTAISSIGDLLSQMKQAALAASDTSISTASRSAYAVSFNSLRDQIKSTVTNASFDGLNLLNSSVSNITSLANASGTKITTAGQSMTLSTSATTGLGKSGLTTGSTFSTATTAATLATSIDKAIAYVNTAAGALGTNSTELQNQNTYVGKLQDSLNQGIGNLVDANLAAESAKLQSLQTKQQLGVQALSIANQSSSLVLSLFR